LITVAIVAVNQMLGTSISLPMEMFYAADSYRHLTGKPYPKLDMKVVAMSPAPITMTGGLRIIPDCTLNEVTQSDLIIVPGLWRNPAPVLRQSDALIYWLQCAHHQGATICAAGTGVCLLAESGMLDHQPATTHWYYFERFEQRYPLVQLQRNHFITQSGRLYCAGSVNSVADLAVHLIEVFYDRDIASRVEQQFSREIRKSYDQIYYSLEDARNHPDEAIIQSQLWMQEHYYRSIKVQEMAERTDMSMRTFNRRFKAATGLSPVQYLQRLRIKAARDLLRKTDLDISAIAEACGFNDEGYFARSFKKQESIKPSEFRQRVRSKLFSL